MFGRIRDKLRGAPLPVREFEAIETFKIEAWADLYMEGTGTRTVHPGEILVIQFKDESLNRIRKIDIDGIEQVNYGLLTSQEAILSKCEMLD